MSLGNFSRAFSEACTLPMLETVFVLTKLLPDSMRDLVARYLLWTTRDFALAVFALPDNYIQPDWDILAESGKLWVYNNTQRSEIGFAELDTPATIVTRIIPGWLWAPAQKKAQKRLERVIVSRISMYVGASIIPSEFEEHQDTV